MKGLATLSTAFIIAVQALIVVFCIFMWPHEPMVIVLNDFSHQFSIINTETYEERSREGRDCNR